MSVFANRALATRFVVLVTVVLLAGLYLLPTAAVSNPDSLQAGTARYARLAGHSLVATARGARGQKPPHPKPMTVLITGGAG